MSNTNLTEQFNIFLPYQRAWVADESPVKVMEKSRRTGITWAEAVDKTLHAAGASGDDVWYIGYNHDMALEFINECADWARKWQHVASAVTQFDYVDRVVDDSNNIIDERKILAYSITFASGWRITALSSRPSNLRGKKGIVIIDEAAFHDNLAELLKAAMAFTIWGGKVIIISTHNGEENEFNTLVKDIRAGRLPYSLHRITFREAVEQGLYERIKATSKAKMPPKAEWIERIYKTYGTDADEELDCIPARGGGTFFPQALIEGVMRDIPVIRYSSPADDFVDWSHSARKQHTLDWCAEHLDPLIAKLNKSLRHFAGVDIARVGDLTIVWPLEETQTLRLETPFLLEMASMPFSEQRRVMYHLFDKLPRFCGAAIDNTGLGRQLAEENRQRYGATRTVEQSLSTSFYAEAMPKAKRPIEDRNCTIPKDAGVLSDFRAIKVSKGVAMPPPEKNKSDDKTDKQQRHGDAAIGFCLAVWAREQLGDNGEPAYESIKKSDLATERTAY